MTVEIRDELAHGAFHRRLRHAREYLSANGYGEALFWLGMALPEAWRAYESRDRYRAERVVMRLHHRARERIREAQWVSRRYRKATVREGDGE